MPSPTNFIPAELRPVVSAIQAELVIDSEKFTLDAQVVNVAREKFNENYNQNCYRSKLASLAGIVSIIGFGFSMCAYVISPISALGLAGASFLLNQVWVRTRNQEGYALQNALDARMPQKAIEHLSMGANIYQMIFEHGGAAPSLCCKPYGDKYTVMQDYARRGADLVVAYLALLEPSKEKLCRMTSNALPYACRAKTAKLLLRLGGSISGQEALLFSVCGKKQDFELLKFYVQAGAKLDGGIENYEEWEEKLTPIKGQRLSILDQLISNPNQPLHPNFKTPLERLLFGDSTSMVRSAFHFPEPSDYKKVLETICEDSSVYLNKSSSQELYHSLNKDGIRIRLEYADQLFMQLQEVAV